MFFKEVKKFKTKEGWQYSLISRDNKKISLKFNKMKAAEMRQKKSMKALTRLEQ